MSSYPNGMHLLLKAFQGANEKHRSCTKYSGDAKISEGRQSDSRDLLVGLLDTLHLSARSSFSILGRQVQASVTFRHEFRNPPAPPFSHLTCRQTTDSTHALLNITIAL